MSHHELIYGPELELDFKRLRTKDDRLDAVRRLYATHYPAVKYAEKALADAHKGYIGIIAPVSAGLFERLCEGSPFSCEELQDNFCLRSAWLAKEMRTIRQAYERQYSAAHNLVNML